MKWAVLVALTLSPLPAQACMFAEYMRQTFFPTLPAALEQHPLVARVKVLRIDAPQRIRLYQPRNFVDRLMQVEVALFRGVAKGTAAPIRSPTLTWAPAGTSQARSRVACSMAPGARPTLANSSND